MNILVLTVGDLQVASTLFRFCQFKDSLGSAGVTLNLVPAKSFGDWESLPSYDLVIVQKRLMSLSHVKKIRGGARKLIWDTDDAIWEPHGRTHSLWTRVRTRARLKAIAAAADLCTVPNECLAAYLRPLAREVAWIPMALDMKSWTPAADRNSGPVRIGWAGAPPNLSYLTKLGKVLSEVQASRPGTQIHIYCGQVPEWGFPVEFIHHPFAPGSEATVVQTFDIGLLPLPDDAFAAGKSPIKALQYAACRIPCIASPIGATREIVRDGETGLTAGNEDEWRAALIRLIDDVEERERLGSNALRMFLENHTSVSVQQRLIKCWRKLARS